MLGPNAGAANVPGPSDAFVTELDPTGTSLVFSTYLGGSDNDVANGVAVDSSGDVFVVGTTSSGDSLLSMGGTTFPTLRAVQPSRVSPGLPVGVGPLGVNASDSSNFDTTSAFVARLAPPLHSGGPADQRPPGRRLRGSGGHVHDPLPDGQLPGHHRLGRRHHFPGSVVASGSPGSPFQIIGSHTYNTLGSYPVGIRVVDTNNDHPAQATTATDVSREKGSQQETTITVDPSNPKRLFAASNDQSFSANPTDARSFFAAYSSDGGVTWARATDGRGNCPSRIPVTQILQMVPSYSSATHAPIFDSFGNLFLVGLVGPNDPVAAKGMAVLLSTNGGKTFRVLTEIAPAGGLGSLLNEDGAIIDQPSIAVGGGSQPSVWITYADFSNFNAYAAGARAWVWATSRPLHRP